MSDKVELVLSYPHDGHKVGDRVAYPVEQARMLVIDGTAVYATVGDADDAGGVPEQAATKRK
jgi:hypothetical protein